MHCTVLNKIVGEKVDNMCRKMNKTITKRNKIRKDKDSKGMKKERIKNLKEHK